MKTHTNYLDDLNILVFAGLLFIGLVSSIPAYAELQRGKESVTELLSELDNVISHHAFYTEKRRQEIHRLTEQLSNCRNERDKLDIYSHLYTQFNSFDADSALITAQNWLTLAQKVGNEKNIRRAELSLAETFSKAGMFKEATDLTKGIQEKPVIPQLKTFFYHILRSTYGYMTEYSINPTQTTFYQRESNRFRDTILTLYPPNSLTYAIVKSGEYNEKRQPDKALALLAKFLRTNDTTIYNNAIFTYTVAETYRLKGDMENLKRFLLYSAIDDLRSGTREYLSLFHLSLLLYKEGDIERAYSYFQTCLNDAQASNSRLRIIEILRIFPEVNKAYQEQIHHQRLREHFFLAFISFLAIILLVSLGFIKRQQKRQKVLNDKLRASNNELTKAYHAVAENSRLKEEYIGRYMDQCSTYIDKLSEYRSGLIKIINTGVVKDLVAKIRSKIDLDDELKEFYANFDETFLQLFPTFVEDFNALLAPQYHIELKNPRQLNTELRIFALIRLGITDSIKIAQFLRYSVTTIYNYRTKTRNKALGNRNEFERKVMEIGKIAD